MDEVLIAEAAEEEYTASLAWYAARSLQAAEGFEAEIGIALKAVAEHPERYPLCDERHRFLLIRRYPFQVIYRKISAGKWLVVAVAHTSRQPGYWIKR
ncbi:MAG: type II toxin-antitoxin system RelE/ParE family toxin [Planctomycetes bacterium]|nr:type II toxin-antitoxin system RelE/ParE family toxin [Planctomycetota bacterium]